MGDEFPEFSKVEISSDNGKTFHPIGRVEGDIEFNCGADEGFHSFVGVSCNSLCMSLEMQINIKPHQSIGYDILKAFGLLDPVSKNEVTEYFDENGMYN